MREKGLTVYDFGSGERMVDKSTISRIINSKENLSRNKLDVFIETLVLKIVSVYTFIIILLL
ncbi:hypothetical protein SUT503_17400 [Streptococcus parasuis]|nr:hypothetical protein SUT503_17400 [Streptococcus parasuis]